MEIKSKYLTFEKLGLTYKDFFYLFVFNQLDTKGELHPSLMYQNLLDLSPGKAYSRAHFYNTVKEMDEHFGWVKSRRDGRKLFYQLTDLGKSKYETYTSDYFQLLHTMKAASQSVIKAIRNPDSPNEPVVLNLEEQRFFSKLVNVRDIVRYFVLQDISKKKAYGSELYKKMKNILGWHSSEGYLYELIHEMEEFTWISGNWDDPIRRKRKLYRLTNEGDLILPKVREQALQTVSSVHDFLAEITSLMAPLFNVIPNK